MAVTRGCDGELKLGSQLVGYIDSFDISISAGNSDTSQIGKEWAEYMGTNKSWSGSASGTLDMDDAGQKKFLDDALGSGSIEADASFKVSATKTLYGHVICTGISIQASHGDKISVSFNFQGSGALSTTAPSA